MDNNLPNNPPDQNNPPPPFGSNFNPHSNPIDPNNPYQSQPPPTSPTHTVDPAQSWVAQHQKRDEHGRFIKSENTVSSNPIPQTPPNPSPPSNPSLSSNLPPPISIKEETKYSSKNDPPLLNMTFTNPVTYFKKWVEKFLKNQDIDLHLRIRPFAAVGLIMTFSVVGGTAFSIGRYFFPYSSPVFHRQVAYPGIIQKGDKNQYYLLASDNTPWKLKSKNTNISLENLVGRQVIVTGNLTAEKYLIEVSELIISESPSQNLKLP